MKKIALLSFSMIMMAQISYSQTQTTTKAKKTTTKTAAKPAVKKTTTTKTTTTTSTGTQKTAPATTNSIAPTATTTTTSKATTSSSVLSGITSSLSSLSQQDVSAGLKEALTIGVKTAATSLNQPNGYFGNPEVKIPFPPEVSQVATKLRDLGMGTQVDAFEKSMNKAAEDAAVVAAPIFTNAITSMTITDAKDILLGNHNAATSYLQAKCTSQLATAFTPHIQTALNNNQATTYWKDLTGYYNKLPFVKPVNTDLVQYTTGKALDGLFHLVGQQETKIRENPAFRSTDILKQVFGAK